MKAMGRACSGWIILAALTLLPSGSRAVAGLCPQGQLMHRQPASPQEVTCCYPTRCGIGYEVSPCFVNGTHDFCKMCNANQNQSQRTSSFTMERCVDWPLNKDCKSIDQLSQPPDILDEQVQRCMCNIEQGWKFVPPEAEHQAPLYSYCQRMHPRCKPGHEPHINGVCRPCKFNYFSAVEGYKLCEPKTNCTMLGLDFTVLSDATADNNCSKPDIVAFIRSTPSSLYGALTTSLIKLTTNEQEVVEVTTTRSWLATTWADTTLRSNTTHTLVDVQQKGDNILVPIVCGVVLLLIILGVIVFIFLYRRRGRHSFLCAGCEQKFLRQPVRASSHLVRNGTKISPNGNATLEASGGSGSPSNGHVDHRARSLDVPPSQYATDINSQFVSPLLRQSAWGQSPDILRTGKHVAFGQHQTFLLENSIDSSYSDSLAGSEQLIPNPSHRENDCLLVHRSEPGSYFTPDTTGSAVTLSTLLNTSEGVVTFSPFSDQNTQHLGHVLLRNGNYFPINQLVGTTAASFIPAADTVKFTRSRSLIASPEGEVDSGTNADEAQMPRFSQLFEDSVDTSNDSPETNTSSPVAPTTQPIKIHPPSTNLHPSEATQTPHKQNPGGHLVLVGPGNSLSELGKPQAHPASQNTLPDHSIMHLKEAVIEDSSHSESLSSNTLLKTSTGVVRTDNVDSLSEPGHQTSPKAFINLCDGDSFSDTSFDSTVLNDTLPIHETDKKSAVPTAAFKNNVHTVHKEFLVHNEVNPAPTPHRQPLPVNVNTEGNGTIGQNRRQPTNSNNLLRQHQPNCRVNEDSGSVLSEAGNVKSSPKLWLGATPTRFSPGGDSSEEETRWKLMMQGNNSLSSSKSSVAGDVGGQEEGNTNLSQGLRYMRSLSQNCPSSCDSAHKPPPRSMSEEKPQKLERERPIAKVRPMPASDSSVNQQPNERATLQQQSAANGTSSVSVQLQLAANSTSAVSVQPQLAANSTSAALSGVGVAGSSSDIVEDESASGSEVTDGDESVR